MGRAKYLLLILMLISSFLIFNQSKAKVVISKIQISGVSSTDEFVELYNYASTSADLTGWSLVKYSAGGTLGNLVSSFPSGTMLNPFGYYLIAHRDYTGSEQSDVAYSNNSNSLASNNSLALRDKSDADIDRIEWGTLESGQTLTRLPNNSAGNYFDSDTSTDFIITAEPPFSSRSPSRPLWQTDEQTNTVSTPTSWDKLRINEVVSSPADGDEWVELYNMSSNTIALAGSTLCDGRTESCTIAELNGGIAAGSWKIIHINGSKLNNDGDSVILKSPDGTILDRIDYSGPLIPGKGQSIARETDGNGNWMISETLTPGCDNIITAPPAAEVPIYVGGGGGASSDLFTIPLNNQRSTGKTKTTEKPVSIIWNVQAPSVVILNSSTLFDAHNSADPRGGEILFTWDFGDGATSEGASVRHSFTTSGIYTVTVRGTSTQDTIGQKTLTVKVDGGPDLVVLGEAMVKPETGEDEWASIQSFSTTSINLNGWKIGTESRSFTIPTGTILKAGRALRFYKTATHLSLVDSGGSISLTNSDGRIVDILDYGKAKRNEIVTEDQIKSSTTSRKVVKKVLGEKYYRSLTIANIRELPLKSPAQVVGTVLSVPGQPYANYFYVRDDSGGIQVYSYKKDFPTLSLGDKVLVRGQLSSSQGQLRLVIQKNGITKTTGQSSSIPEQLRINELSPEYAGTLIVVEGEVTSLKSTQLYLDDGDAEIPVTLPKKLEIPKGALGVGMQVRITGIFEESKSGSRLIPRFKNDIVILSSKQIEQKKPPVSTATIYGSIGAMMIALAASAKKWLIK